MAESIIQATTKFFFDQQRILDAVDRAAVKGLSRFGAFVRQRARTSIRDAPRKILRRDPNAVSKPGKPPFNRTGRLRNQIFFSYDAANTSVVVGPILYGSKSGAPEVLEYGGVGNLTNPNTGQHYRKFIRQRPFMTPAFDAERAKAALQFQNLIH